MLRQQRQMQKTLLKTVAEALRGKTPRLKDGSKELTKEDILKIKNRTERQKAMTEHPELFR